MRMRSSMGLVCSLCVLACTNSPADSTVTKDMFSTGKADEAMMEKICTDAGLEPGCDVCAVMEWYDDGACEEFCAEPDPDCAGPTTETCSTSRLPRVFNGVAEGSGSDSVDVELRLVASDMPICTRGGYVELWQLLDDFLDYVSWIDSPVEPHVGVYRIANADGIPFFVGFNSSMGHRTQENLLQALQESLGDEGEGCRAFEKEGSLVSRIDTDLENFADAAANITAILEHLTEGNQDVNRPVHQRGCPLDSFSGLFDDAFFVDPHSGSGPETEAYLVVIRSGWEE